MNSAIIISEELRYFIKEHADDHYTQQLILFFTDHPQARFSELAIIHALSQNGGRGYIQKALKHLVEKGILKMSTDSNVVFYSLTENMRSLVLELTRLDIHQRRLLLRKICPNFTTRESTYVGEVAKYPLNLVPSLVTRT